MTKPARNQTMANNDKKLLSRFKPVHLHIAQLHVLGKSHVEIGQIVGWHETSVGRILKSPLVKVEVNRLQSNLDNILFDADLRMKSLVHRSLDVLERVLGDKDTNTLPAGDLDQQIKIATKVLDGVLNMRRGDGNAHITNIQNIQQIMVDARSKSDQDLVKDVMSRVKESKAALK